MRASVESDLTTIEADLDKEAADDEELRQRFGVRWTVPPSLALTKQLRDKVAGYRNNLSVAGESDAKLMERLNSNASMLGGLSMEAASRQLPRLQAPMVPVGDVDPVVLVNTLRQAMDTMQQLSSQRAVLEESLKVWVCAVGYTHMSAFHTHAHTNTHSHTLSHTHSQTHSLNHSHTHKGGEEQGQYSAQAHGLCRQLRRPLHRGNEKIQHPHTAN